MIARILVPLDGSRLAAQALSDAALVATGFGAKILLFRVIDLESAPPQADGSTERIHPCDEAESYLCTVSKELTAQSLEVECHVSAGRPAESIVAYANSQAVDLIVMSTHGRGGIGRWVYGSVADKVLRGADVPVLLIRASEGDRSAGSQSYQRLLVPLDGSEVAELALPFAEAWARTFDAELILLRVPTLPPYVSLGPEASMMVPSLLSDAYSEADAYLANVVRRIRAQGLTVHKAAVEPGGVAETIIDYANDSDIDCIVMSTHGRSGLQRWVYGSVADRVLRGASAPILLVRASEEQLSSAVSL